MDTLKLCWRPIKENPGDFDAWTRLLQCVEQLVYYLLSSSFLLNSSLTLNFNP